MRQIGGGCNPTEYGVCGTWSNPPHYDLIIPEAVKPKDGNMGLRYLHSLTRENNMAISLSITIFVTTTVTISTNPLHIPTRSRTITTSLSAFIDKKE
jgi:hypothetical protein